jgi:hypothetical protein
MFAAASMLLCSSLFLLLSKICVVVGKNLKYHRADHPFLIDRVKTSLLENSKPINGDHQRRINDYIHYSLSTHFDIINDQLVPKEEVKKSNTSIRLN